MNVLNLKPGQLTLAHLRQAYLQPLRVSLDAGAAEAIAASVACVENIVAQGRTAYGINTGFGLLAQTRIAREDLENLQRSLVLSHAAGVGEPLDDAMVRLIMLLKINSLARGFSGIRRKVIDALIGIKVPNLTGGISEMLPNHHITKPVLIGEIEDNGQFDVVWKTPGLVPGAAWSPRSWAATSDGSPCTRAWPPARTRS